LWNELYLGYKFLVCAWYINRWYVNQFKHVSFWSNLCSRIRYGDVCFRWSNLVVGCGLKKWDLYFCALGSLVVLRFPQLLSFSSVLSKPMSETLTSAGTAGCPMGQQLWSLSAD
jgi:hypothetical protein